MNNVKEWILLASRDIIIFHMSGIACRCCHTYHALRSASMLCKQSCCPVLLIMVQRLCFVQQSVYSS